MTESAEYCIYGWAELGKVEPWSTLSWGYTQCKPYAIKLYARLGLHPILLNGILDDGACTCGRPDCDKSRGKHPRFKNWETAPLNVAAIDRALERQPRFNIGLRTGLQPCGRGLCVVDVDGPRELLAPLEQEHGAFPPTLTARTGSGGLHLYYWLRDGIEIGNRAGVVPHVDFRGFGGQVVAPPSLHLSGNKYTWIDAREPAVLP
jgi:putative DNA primase/helicase